MGEDFKQEKDNLKNTLCYIPFVAFYFYLVEKNKTDIFKQHIKYGMLLFVLYIVFQFIFKLTGLIFFSSLLFLAYMIISIILGYKAFNGEKIDIEVLDEIGEKIEDKIK